MSTFYDLLVDIKAAILADTALASWATSNFGRPVTVKIGNIQIKRIRPEEYPVVALIFSPGAGDLEQQDTVTPYVFNEVYKAGLGLHHDDPDTGTRLLGEFEEKLADAVQADPSRSNMADHTFVSARIPDEGVNHPKHFTTVAFTIMRDGNF